MAEKIVETTPKPVAKANGSAGVAVDATADVARHPSAAEHAWEKNTLEPTLAKSPERDARLHHGVELPDTPPLHRSRPSRDWNPEKRWIIPASRLTRAAFIPRCTADKLWTMRQFAGFGTAQDTNARFRYLLSQGQTGLSVAFDLPTLMGYDADHPLSEGEVGKCGVAISSLADMEVLFDKIPLADVTTSMTINSPASVIWAMYLAVAEKQGADWKKISGTLQNDILKEYIAQKEYIYPPEPSMRLVVDTLEFGAKQTPKFNPDFDQRVSHSRGRLDGDSGIGVHAARRNRVRRMGAAARDGCG